MVVLGESMNLSELGARIRKRRDNRGLRQSDLAAALRVSPQAVSKWERGENAPDITILVPLSRLLDVSVEWLLGGSVSERETFEAVVFVTSLDDFAARAETTAPSGLAAWVNGLHLTVTEALRAFDGVPVKYVGDGFLGFFTGSRMRSRGVQAALRSRALVDHAGLRIALHSGDVYLGTIGHPEYATPDILGASVNTAFMMLPHSAEARGRVVVSESVTDEAQAGMRFSSMGHFDLGQTGARLELYEPVPAD